MLAQDRFLLKSLAAGLLVLPTLYCKHSSPSNKSTAFSSEAPDEGSDPRAVTVATYAQECAREVGLELSQLPDMSCLAGTHINIMVNDGVLTPDLWKEFVDGGRKCDNPQWLSPTGCYSYDYGQMLTIGEVDVFLNCRQKFFPDRGRGDRTLNGATTKFQRFVLFQEALASGNTNAADKMMRHAFYFNDLGVIVRNSKTGKVCYLTKFAGGETPTGEFFGGFIPSPGRRTPPSEAEFKAVLSRGITAGMDIDTTISARQKEGLANLANEPLLASPSHQHTAGFFHNPSGGTICVTCHTTGGFKWSPFMQVSGLVPDISDASRKPMLPVGETLKEAMRSTGMIEVKSNTTSACTSCHRMASSGVGAQRTCGSGFYMALGRYSPTLRDQYTAKYLGYPQVSWMPEGHERGTEGEFNADYAVAIRKTECCCRNPSAQGCSWKRYGPTEPEVDTAWRSGPAPREIEDVFHIGSSSMNCNNP